MTIAYAQKTKFAVKGGLNLSNTRFLVIKNGESAPKLDKHTVKNICGSYYLISYFSMFGMGEETFNKYECMNSITEHVKCF